MATVVVGFIDSLIDSHVDVALLRNPNVRRSDYDSAWTLQTLTGAAKSLTFIGVAPLLAAHYGDPRIATITYIIALRPVIEGFENIGQINFRRYLQFDKEFRYWVYRRVLTFFITVGIALWLRNYLALALAAPVNGVVTVFASYVMSGYRPRFTTSRINEIWNVSRWWIFITGIRYFGSRGEAFILGGLTTPQVIGAYTVGFDLSGHLTEDLVGPVGRALVPNYAKMLDDPKQLLWAFRLSFALLATVSLAVGVGASLVANDLILVLLGEKWRSAVPFVRWLAINGAFWSMLESMQPYFVVTRRDKLYALCSAAYVAFLIPGLVLAAHIFDVEAVAMMRTAITGLFLLGMLGVLIGLRVFELKQLLSFFWRPVVAISVMAVCVSSVDIAAPAIVALGLKLMTGLTVFTLVLLALWSFCGYPNGLENAALSLLSDYITAARRRLRDT
jgi:O-antigen/teichoic acid export membrane protein